MLTPKAMLTRRKLILLLVSGLVLTAAFGFVTLYGSLRHAAALHLSADPATSGDKQI